MSRLLYNQAIIDKLQELIKKYPDIRFGQLLINTGILSQEDEGWVIDPFYIEPKITWEDMCNNSFCFEK